MTLPSGVVTVMFPVVAPLGTVQTIWVVEMLVTVADRPVWNVTVVLVPRGSKFVPSIVTLPPAYCAVGARLEMLGAPKIAKATCARPALVSTCTSPVVAPDGTVTLTLLEFGLP